VGEAPLRDFSLPLNYSRGKQPVWLLHANGEDVKVVQVLLRHGSARITMDVYAQAMTSAKRLAQGKVVAMLRCCGRGKRRGDKTCVSPLCPRRKARFPTSLLFCWRPRRDLNPCYRRERRADGKLLKLRNTDGYLKRFQ